MRKIVGTIWFFIALFLGWVFVGFMAFAGNGTYRGHTGYCRSDALPLYNVARVVPLIVSVLLVLYWIVVETFLLYRRQAAVARVLLPLCCAILLYLVYNICQYPFVNRRFGFLGQSDYQEGVRNLLMFSGSVLSVTLILFTLRFRYKLPTLKRLSLLSYAVAGIFFVAIGLVCVFAKYEVCYG